MKLLITGILGFVGSNLAKQILLDYPGFKVFGIDNFSRKGCFYNVQNLLSLGISFSHGDLRTQSDLEILPKADWVIDCAANPSVLAGLDGDSSSRQLMEHNLLGTINLLEYCKRNKAGLILLSTSRVYSASLLSDLPVMSSGNRFELRDCNIAGLSCRGISEDFSTSAPISLYGASKLASEALILEYGECFDFPVWINRCGVLAGAGQFGKADQGIFSYWVHSFREKKPLKYIGFNGTGHQVRDTLHPKDLVSLLSKQIMKPNLDAPKITNVGGGIENSMSLKELSNWCEDRFGPNNVIASEDKRPMDAPWIVMDNTTAQYKWDWHVSSKIEQILDEIGYYAEKNPHWLGITH